MLIPTASKSTFLTKNAKQAALCAPAPLYEKQKSMGAVFGLNYGWEHPLWFAGEGKSGFEEYGFERQDWFNSVKAECAALRENVGIIDVSNFGKYAISGKGAREWLDKVVANKVPTETGRSCLTPLLGIRGGIAGDFTITMLGEDDYFMVGSGMAERYHQRYFNMVPRPDTVTFKVVTNARRQASTLPDRNPVNCSSA